VKKIREGFLFMEKLELKDGLMEVPRQPGSGFVFYPEAGRTVSNRRLTGVGVPRP